MPAYTTLSLRERAGVRVGISSTSASGFRRDCTLTPKSLSRRERDDPIRQSLLESRAAILSRYCRLMPMPPAPLRNGEGSRKLRSEKPTDLVKDAVGMVQDQMVGQTKDDEACGRKPSIATAAAQRPWEVRSTVGFDDKACL